MDLKKLWAKKDWLERRRDKLKPRAEALRKRSWEELGLPEPEVWKDLPRPKLSRDAAISLALVEDDLRAVWAEIGRRAGGQSR
jgi:hypothetical protein